MQSLGLRVLGFRALRFMVIASSGEPRDLFRV